MCVCMCVCVCVCTCFDVLGICNTAYRICITVDTTGACITVCVCVCALLELVKL